MIEGAYRVVDIKKGEFDGDLKETLRRVRRPSPSEANAASVEKGFVWRRPYHSLRRPIFLLVSSVQALATS